MPKLLARISRDFLKENKAHRYRTQSVEDMTDSEVVSSCHRFCEENGLMREFNVYRERIEAEYVWCEHLGEYVSPGACYDMQMIAGGYIKPDSLPDIKIERLKLMEACERCDRRL